MEKINNFLTLCVFLLIAYGIGWIVGRTRITQTIEPQTIHHETTIYDTITQIEEKSVEIAHIDTVFLPVFLNDTIKDTLKTEIPINRYLFDTIGVHAVVTGYGVTLDTLQVEKKIITDSIFVPRKRNWHFGFGFAIGLGYVK